MYMYDVRIHYSLLIIFGKGIFSLFRPFIKILGRYDDTPDELWTKKKPYII